MTIHNKTHLYMEQVSVDKVSEGVGWVDYGYTRMTIHNKTHLYMEQVSVDKVSEQLNSKKN